MTNRYLYAILLPIISATAAIPAFSPFRPSPEAAAAIFTRIASGSESLADLAAAHSTSIEAFALWLESPEAQERLARLSAGLANFARLGAIARLPIATGALASLIDHFRHRCALAAAKPADGSAPLPSPMDDIRERRLVFSAACLILRISRTPDRPRTISQLSQRTAASTPHPPSSLRPDPPVPPVPPVRPDNISINALDPAARSPASAGAYPARTLPFRSPLARGVYAELSIGIPADEAAGLYESMRDASDDDVRAIVEKIRSQFGDDYIPKLNDIVPRMQPDSGAPAHLRGVKGSRDGPATLLAAAGAAGPAP